MDASRPHTDPDSGIQAEPDSAQVEPTRDSIESAWADAIDAMPVSIPAAPPKPPGLTPRTAMPREPSWELPIDVVDDAEEPTQPDPLFLPPLDIPVEPLLPELPPLPAGALTPLPPAPPFVPQPSLHARVPVAPVSGPSSVPAGPAAPRLARRFRGATQLGPKGKTVIGIDLGTTNCCAAVIEEGRAHVLASTWGRTTIPSVVSYRLDGTVLVGEPALERAATHAKHTILGSKRLVGRAFHSPIVQMVRNHFAYEIVQGDLGEAALLLEQEVVSLEEVSVHLLEEVKRSAELQLDGPINRAVITCPAFFNERQRESVRAAGEMAGFHVERVLSEPTAAALHYGFGQSMETRRVLVYDLGGGTFDVSVLEVDGTVFEVIGTGGDTFLGGVDFDASISEMIVRQFVRETGLDPRADEAALAIVFRHAEKAKIDLSERPSTIVHIENLHIHHHPPKSLVMPIKRSDVDARFDRLLEHTFEIVSDVLGRVGLTVPEIDDVLVVGGQTRYPLVRNRVREFFGQDPKESVNPDEAVARGAAQFAAGIDRFDNVVLIDALPMSIGIGLPGGRFEKLIHRDTRLPAETTYSIRTVRNNQTEVTILIFQGEDERVAHNEPLGMLVLSGLPKGPKGSIVIDVKLKVTDECVLELSAIERKSGKKMESRFATKDTPESLRQKLGLPPHPSQDEIDKQTAELDRPKNVWRWLTGVFGESE